MAYMTQQNWRKWPYFMADKDKFSTEVISYAYECNSNNQSIKHITRAISFGCSVFNKHY